LNRILQFAQDSKLDKLKFTGTCVVLSSEYKKLKHILSQIGFQDVHKTAKSLGPEDCVIYTYEKIQKVRRFNYTFDEVNFLSLGYIVDLLSGSTKKNPVLPPMNLYSHHLLQLLEFKKTREEKSQDDDKTVDLDALKEHDEQERLNEYGTFIYNILFV